MTIYGIYEDFIYNERKDLVALFLTKELAEKCLPKSEDTYTYSVRAVYVIEKEEEWH